MSKHFMNHENIQNSYSKNPPKLPRKPVPPDPPTPKFDLPAPVHALLRRRRRRESSIGHRVVSAGAKKSSQLRGSSDVVYLCYVGSQKEEQHASKGTSIENRCLFAHSAASSGWTCQMEAPSMFLSSPELLHLIHVHQKEHAHGDPVRSCELCRTPPSFLHRRPQKAVPPVYTAFLRLTAFNPTSPAHSAQSKQSITGLCSEPMAHADQEARSVYCLSHGGGSTDDVFSKKV